MEDVNVTPPAPEKKDNKKTGAIIATVATGLCCGLPGLGSMCAGLISAVTGFMPSSGIDVYGTGGNTTMAIVWGAVSCFGGLIALAIPIVVGVLTLRKPKAPKEEEAPGSSEPIPPAA